MQGASGELIILLTAGGRQALVISLGIYLGLGAGQGAVAGRVVVGPAIKPDLLLGNGVNNLQVVVICGQFGGILGNDNEIGLFTTSRSV